MKHKDRGSKGAPLSLFREQKQEESRQSFLSQILTPEARARLSRIALVKTEKARAVEELIIQAVRTGKIRGGTGPGGKIGEKDVINVLEQVEGTKQEQQVIVIICIL